MVFQGIAPPLITPLTEDGELDAAGLRRFIAHVLQGGVAAVVVLGSSGEAALLHPRVRRRVVEVALETVDHRVPVVVGTGEPGTTLAAESTHAAAEAGADAAIVVPPYYFPIDQEAAKRHYRTVHEVGGLPILAYHIPSMTKVPLQSETVVALAEEGTLCGIKDSAGDFGYFQRIVDGTHGLDGFAALQGSDHLLFAGMAYGGAGGISVLSQVAPAVVVALYTAAINGDWRRAMALHHRLREIGAAIGAGWIPAIKGALSALEICAPYVAAPNVPWSAETLAAQRARIEDARRGGLFDPATVQPRERKAGAWPSPRWVKSDE